MVGYFNDSLCADPWHSLWANRKHFCCESLDNLTVKFFFDFCMFQSNQTAHSAAAYENHRQSFCLCRNFFHHDWFRPLKHQANWINMMFPVLLLSALLNPPLRKQRLTVWFLTYSEAAAKTNFCDSLSRLHNARKTPLFLGWCDLKKTSLYDTLWFTSR